MADITEEIRQHLMEMQDPQYRDFHGKLMPGIDREAIIGVRIPQLRQYAKQVAKDPRIKTFLNNLPHTYYEENNLHGFVLEQIWDYDDCLQELERFLPYIDNWATCDTCAPKVLVKHPDRLLESVRVWLASGHTYTVRYGIGMLMRCYLDERFQTEHLEMVAALRSQEYYVNMMIAWYFATALAKQYEAALPYLQQQRLDIWTHNKAIRKACESSRITKEHKDYLRGLKRK